MMEEKSSKEFTSRMLKVVLPTQERATYTSGLPYVMSSTVRRGYTPVTWMGNFDSGITTAYKPCKCLTVGLTL